MAFFFNFKIYDLFIYLLFFYYRVIPQQDIVNVLNAVEYMTLLTTLLNKVPYQLSIKNWDVIRIGLGHWILSVTKSLDYALENMDQKVSRINV